MRRLSSLMHWLDSRLTIRSVGIGFAVASPIIIVLGHIAENGSFDPALLFRSLWANVGVDLASIAITVLLIDRLIQRRDKDAYKARLIRNIRSQIRSTSLRALEELGANGWLYDGTLRFASLSGAGMEGMNLKRIDFTDADLSLSNLRGADLSLASLQGADLNSTDFTRANLQGADLREANLLMAKLEDADLTSANLEGAALVSANLEGANLSGANLSKAKLQRVRNLAESQIISISSLRGAEMANGKRYDGRYNLAGDLLEAIRVGINKESFVKMAEFYEVSVEDYEIGQEWARVSVPE